MSAKQLGQDVIEQLEGYRSAQYLALASFCVILYEYLVLLPEEMQNFWCGSNILTQSLFLLNRYLTPVTYILHLMTLFLPQLSTNTCDLMTVWTVSLTALGILIVEAVLVLRVYVLYSGLRKAQLLLLVSFLAAVITSAALMGNTLKSVKSERNPAPQLLVGCFYSTPSQFWAVFVPPFVFETILFLLTFVRAFRGRTLTESNIPIFKCLIRDGTAYFLVAFLSLGFTSLGSISGPQIAFPAMLSNFLLAALSICSSRLLLHMRSLAAGPRHLPTRQTSTYLGKTSEERRQSLESTSLEMGALTSGTRVTRGNKKDLRVSIVIDDRDDMWNVVLAENGAESIRTGGLTATRVGRWDEEQKGGWRASEDWHLAFRGK